MPITPTMIALRRSSGPPISTAMRPATPWARRRRWTTLPAKIIAMPPINNPGSAMNVIMST